MGVVGVVHDRICQIVRIYGRNDLFPVGGAHSFRQAVGAQKVIGLLAIIGWFINLNWPSVFR